MTVNGRTWPVVAPAVIISEMQEKEPCGEAGMCTHTKCTKENLLPPAKGQTKEWPRKREDFRQLTTPAKYHRKRCSLF